MCCIAEASYMVGFGVVDLAGGEEAMEGGEEERL